MASYRENLARVEDIMDHGEWIKERIDYGEDSYTLESLATILLRSDDILDVDSDRIEYRRHDSQVSFLEAQKNWDGNMLVIDYMRPKSFSKAHVLPKDQVITFEDRSGEVISDYWDAMELVDNVRMKKDLKIDMLMAKTKLRGTIYFKHVMEGSCDTSWELMDYTNLEHIEAALKVVGGKMSGWMGCIGADIRRYLGVVELTDLQRRVVKLWRNNWDWEYQDVADALGEHHQTVIDALVGVCNKIRDVYIREYDDWYYTYQEKGVYKKCIRCDQVKLTIDFGQRKNGRYYNQCRECEKMRKSTA